MTVKQAAKNSEKLHKKKPRICALYEDRRKHVRIPVQMALRVRVKGRSSAVFCDTNVINISEGGICIEWTSCAQCGGYLTGRIHPECVLSPYDSHKKPSFELDFYCRLPDREIHFKGKAVYIFRTRDAEQIGIAFTDISEEDCISLMSAVFSQKAEKDLCHGSGITK